MRAARDELPTAVLTGRFTEAVRWASHLHADQARKGTRIAYVSHLLAVSSLVLEDGGTEEEAIAGVLHDAIEDCHVAEAEIRARFGAPVAEIVVACSEDRDSSRDQDWEARKRRYLDHLRDPALPSEALRVSAADKLHNARSILSDLREHGPEIWDRFNAPADAQQRYYAEVAQILRDRHDSVLTRELGRVVGELTAEIDRSG
ncbi:MAG TPA: HD domain-containing protein [Acidimicrobiia bacterium]|nr:HD domain-containing protein [Acidimicrobiia bacterium]